MIRTGRKARVSRLAVPLVLVPALALLAAGCGSDDDTATAAPSASATASAEPHKITVLAAASLTETFTTLGKQFEAAHPGTTVTFSFAASSALAQQINSGAPADVFASASAKNMTEVVDAGNATGPTTFATNSLEIAVPADNPAKIDEIGDLDEAGVKVALCEAQVPCGVAATTVLDKAGEKVTPVTYGADVKAVLTSVSLGEVDAGLVYRTDVASADPKKVIGVEIPADVNAKTSYPIVALKESKDAETAKAFVDYVLSADGTKVLTEAGFGPAK
ncbi:molybdate ABC transporter substrate-binding protein [Parafrankia sp. EUN1f]|uniref:molybdate ABC transporter substrate-binding protein n=1 Tax=Parafrankia sp. EUN1f TaxID=102897 RepID=UPI0001C439E2|nr:molybdate ABC transporter substrate-binding protein [Parafrankia sp. EUN1f]EFC85451.1 molybdenum ABC transporter, periplasmic molybdate-binding protein [Parafrankia sp. EUN1f]